MHKAKVKLELVEMRRSKVLETMNVGDCFKKLGWHCRGANVVTLK
jgi:hypothetical protein